MAWFPPSPPEPPSPPPTENVYTPSQFESVKDAFKHFLFRIIPAKLHPVFLILHDKEDNPYPSVDLRGRVLTRDDLIESEIYDLRRQCTNDGSNAGNHSVKLEPAANSIVLLNFASIVNNDAASRAGFMHIYTAGGVALGTLNLQATMSSDVPLVFPTLAAGGRYLVPGHSLILTDVFEILLQVSAIAISEESSYFLEYSFIGDAPTITETGPSGSVFADVS